MVHCALLFHWHITSITHEDSTTTGSNWIEDGKKRQAGEPHDALNGPTDRDKGASRVRFMVQERMSQVEYSAQANTARLTHRSRAGENRSPLDTKRIALGKQREKPSLSGQPWPSYRLRELGKKARKYGSHWQNARGKTVSFENGSTM